MLPTHILVDIAEYTGPPACHCWICVMRPPCGCFTCVERAKDHMLYYKNALGRSCMSVCKAIRTESETTDPPRVRYRVWPPLRWRYLVTALNNQQRSLEALLRTIQDGRQ